MESTVLIPRMELPHQRVVHENEVRSAVSHVENMVRSPPYQIAHAAKEYNTQNSKKPSVGRSMSPHSESNMM